MRIRPVTPARLVDELAGRITATPAAGFVRVGFDGADSAEPGALADALVDPLRVLGRPAVRVDLADFLRPASVRLELGRNNPDSFYERWYDLAALSREVLGPLAPGGSGRIVTTFWNPDTDRSSRPSYVDVPTGGVLLLSGPLLQGAGLDLDLVVHCAQSPAALARRTREELRWTLPAFDRYRDEVDPASLADVVVRVDDPGHPALVEA
ncbi:uridine kinase [Rugosimonospora africana]|uniref:Uridine kinase n=1 Tax=Rugosimonospora africana TaxID=556532 RepID=A0A8J3QZD3_9ACTN|nr:uridine kinase [Rugosimonospora africana]GIH17406.1 uridine kinase [Rugosimonospora africana]